MLIVNIPMGCIQEKKYIINTIFGTFLGVDFQIRCQDSTDYRIDLGNGNTLIVKDQFFRYFDGKDYLKEDVIPSNVSFLNSDLCPEGDLPILYGNEELSVSSQKIVCGLDLFASSFFMLTRWEEMVNPNKDHYNRFPATQSVAYLNDFLHRPIVNEYTEFIWNLLRRLDYKGDRKEHNAKMMLTHDVDHIRFWNPEKCIRSIAGDLLKRKSIFTAYRTLISYPFKRDPFNTFEWLMDVSESFNVKSHFYFMSGGNSSYDNFYSISHPMTRKIIKKMIDRGHLIGFHPSFNSYNNPVQWEKEKIQLENVLGFGVKEGRQHFLRFSIPETWRIWNDNSMEMDSSLCYADHEGFRCGVCYPFHPYDVLSREIMNLKEYPLTCMEVSFTVYQDITPEEMMERIKVLVDKVKKYRGVFVLLWHNSSFDIDKWGPFKKVYLQTIEEFYTK